MFDRVLDNRMHFIHSHIQ